MPTAGFVTSCDSAFLPGAIAVLKGIKHFHPEVTRYCFVPESDIAHAELVLEGLAIVRPLRPIKGVPDRNQAGVARLSAISLQEDVILYADSDICICGPITECWNVGAGRVRAVHDASTVILDNVPLELKESFVRAFPEGAENRGFNSGVLGFRPKDWPKLIEDFESFLAQGNFPFYPSILDQPILNALMFSKVDWLPAKFNAHVVSTRGIPDDVRIIHYTGPEKPWMDAFPKHEPSYYYWLRYGIFESRKSKLIQAKLSILLRTPRRLLMNRVRKVLNLRA